MKWLKWISSLILVLIALTFGSIYFLFNPTLQKLKPEIVKTLSQALGTEISVGSISAQILPSPKIELSSLSVGGPSGAQLKRLFIDTSISELLAGKFAISEITIEGPSAEIVKLEDGAIQIGKLKLGGKVEAAPQGASDAVISADKNAQSESSQKAIDFKISKLSVIDGKFTYADLSKDLKVAISDFSLLLSEFSPDTSSPVKINFIVFDKSPASISIDGSFIANSLKSKTPKFNLNLFINSLDLGEVVKLGSKFSPQLAKLTYEGAINSKINLDSNAQDLKIKLELDAAATSLKGALNGNLNIDLNKKPIPDIEGFIDISGVKLDSFNIPQLGGKFLFKKNLISTDSLNLLYKGESISITGDLLRYVGNNFDTPSLKITTLGGSVLIQNNFLNEGDKPFSGSIFGSGIDLRRLVALSSNLPPYSVAGNLTRFSSKFKGTAANLKQDLSASCSLAIADGEILGVNIIGGVFQKIGALPGLGDTLISYLPEKYKPLVTASNSTSFDSFSIEANLTSGSEINLAKAELIHSAYLISGSGRASTKGSLDLKSQMKITKAVTEGMVAKNDKLLLLLDKDDNLTFPLLISKSDGPLLVLPDVSELGRNALRNSAKEATSKALDKVAPGLGSGASKLLNKLF